MIVNKNVTINMNAVSAIDVSGSKGTPVLYMNASIKNNGEMSVNMTITDPDLYAQNMEEADADFTAFKKEAMSLKDN